MNLSELAAKIKKLEKKIETKPSLKKRVTLVNYRGEKDPRAKDTLTTIQVTLPTSLVNEIDRYIAVDDTFDSRRAFIAHLIEEELFFS